MAAVAATPAFFRIYVPEFASKTDQEIQSFLDVSLPYVNFNVWGVKSDLIHAYWAAHLMTLAGRGAVLSGQTSKEKVGDLEISYANPSNIQLSDTTYSNLIEQLRKTVLTTPLVIT